MSGGSASKARRQQAENALGRYLSVGKEDNMPNGKPGDHPWTDIVFHGLDVFSPNIDKLVREIYELGHEVVLPLSASSFDWDLEELERDLIKIRDRRLQEGLTRKRRKWTRE